MRQGNGVETLPGAVKGVSSSCCFPLLVILTRRIGDREDDGVAYAEIALSSSKDEEGDGRDSEEGKGEEGEKSSPSRLWQMSPQSCCVMYSAMNARGIT